MDQDRFERIAKILAEAETEGVGRRALLKRLVAGGVAGLLALRGGQAAQGAKPKKCRWEWHACEGNQECCPGLECRVAWPGHAKRCVKPKGTTKKPTTTTKKPTTTTTTKKPTTTTTKKPTTTTTKKLMKKD